MDINYTSELVEQNQIERDIENLHKQISEKKELLANKEVTEKALIKQALHPIIKSQAVVGQNIPATAQTVNDDLPNYLNSSSEEIKNKVGNLLKIAFSGGIEKAAAQAQKFGPFIVDSFHDALSDKLYEELKKRKLI